MSVFDSSDAVRTAAPLKHAQYASFNEPLPLEHGDELPSVTVAYETYGTLSPERDNAVLICHALSGDSHVARHDDDDLPGWWDLVVGPGKCIDTDRWFVVCPNILGGCRGTTGPNSINPKTDLPYGGDFPIITVGDMVNVQRRLIEHMGIERLRAVVGGSLGGHMALTWATRHADCLQGVVALATSPRLTSQALAFDIVGRNAIRRDPDYAAGQYYGTQRGPAHGLAIARMLGHITYLSREAMMQKFDAHRLQPRDLRTQFETKFSVGSYLAHQGDKFVERFDANSYVTLTMAMDLFDMGETAEQLADALRAASCRWLVVSYTSDWLFPSFQSREIVDALIANEQPVSYCNVRSDCGHDAFLLDNELHLYGEMVRAFLCNLDETPATNGDAATSECEPNPVHNSLFHQRRVDYESIVDLIPAGASVLDLGCGTGGLLSRLAARSHDRLVGLELDEEAILACVRRGLDVVHADLNDGLAVFRDGQFDFVVLSQTLQAVLDVERLVDDMLRVGRRAIVSFPNLGYRPLRAQLAEEGRAPRILPLQGHQWYNTPDLRFLTIADFEHFCREHAIEVHQRIALDTAAHQQVDDDPNLNADVAVFVISRP
jgi:homoserine O-acetyltransferase